MQSASILYAGGGTFSGHLAAPIFYDSNDSNYYVDPNGMSKQVRLTNLGTYGGNADNARNHFVQYNAGTATPAAGWIAAAFGDDSANRVVIGQWGSTTQAIIGSHNGGLDDWAQLGYAATEHIFYSPSWDSGAKLQVNTNGVYAPAYRGNANVGGTGTATWHPDGIYCGGTMWQYGSQYKNVTGIYDLSEIAFYTAPKFFKNNTQNLTLRAYDGNSAIGLLGQGSGGEFGFQIYGAGDGYGFLGYAWGDWDLRKVPDGAMYMNNNNSYYLQTDGTSRFNVINANQLATGDTLYFSGLYGNTYNSDTMYFQGRYVASNIQSLDLYIGDDGRNTVLPDISGGQDGSIDAFCIKATNDGIHHIFDSAGDAWHGRHLYTPNGNMYMGGNIVATQSWTSSQGYWNTDLGDPKDVQSSTVRFAGDVEVQGTFTETSSIRYKENIVDLEPATEKVEQLRPVRYNKIGSEVEEIGLIAEEVAEIYPEVVTYNDEGQPDGINYTRLSVVLLKTVQELSERINKLESK